MHSIHLVDTPPKRFQYYYYSSNLNIDGEVFFSVCNYTAQYFLENYGSSYFPYCVEVFFKAPQYINDYDEADEADEFTPNLHRAWDQTAIIMEKFPTNLGIAYGRRMTISDGEGLYWITFYTEDKSTAPRRLKALAKKYLSKEGLDSLQITITHDSSHQLVSQYHQTDPINIALMQTEMYRDWLRIRGIDGMWLGDITFFVEFPTFAEAKAFGDELDVETDDGEPFGNHFFEVYYEKKSDSCVVGLTTINTFLREVNSLVFFLFDILQGHPAGKYLYWSIYHKLDPHEPSDFYHNGIEDPWGFGD